MDNETLQSLASLLVAAEDKDQLTAVLKLLLSLIEDDQSMTHNRKETAKAHLLEVARTKSHTLPDHDIVPNVARTSSQVAAKTIPRVMVGKSAAGSGRLPGDEGGALTSDQIARYTLPDPRK